MTRTRSNLVAFGVALACALTLPAAALTIELPAETARLKTAPGSDVATAQCGTCHSFDYVSTQPAGKPLAFWKAEVEKMKKVYGAPIPDDQIDPIAQYLAHSYGDAK